MKKNKKIIICVIILLVIGVLSYFVIIPYTRHCIGCDDSLKCKTYGSDFDLYKSVNKIDGKYNYYCCNKTGNCIGNE